MNTTADKTRQFCLVLTQFPICNCSVSNILRSTENLEIGNWVETTQNCLVLFAVVFTPLKRTRQDKTRLCCLVYVGGVPSLPYIRYKSHHEVKRFHSVPTLRHFCFVFCLVVVPPADGDDVTALSTPLIKRMISSTSLSLRNVDTDAELAGVDR